METLAIQEMFRDVMNKYPSLYDLEKELMKLPQTEEKLYHHFMGGVYIRELHIPAGSLIIGKRHRGKTCNMLMKGRMALYNEADGSVTEISAPLVFESEPLTKKMAFCFSDCVFMNIHPTTETDIDKIEQIFTYREGISTIIFFSKGEKNFRHGQPK
jgi:hypothetical protein